MLAVIPDNFKTRATDMPSDDEDVKIIYRRIDEQDRKLDRCIDLQEKNTIAIANLSYATQGMVDAWSTARNLQRFVKWLSGFAIIGAMVAMAVGGVDTIKLWFSKGF